MDVAIGTAVAVGTALFTAGGAWIAVKGATDRLLAQRKTDTEAQAKALEVAIDRIEAQRATDTAAQAKELERVELRVNERLREYAEKKDDQARRIGRTEERCSSIEGSIGLGGVSGPVDMGAAGGGRVRRPTRSNSPGGGDE